MPASPLRLCITERNFDNVVAFFLESLVCCSEIEAIMTDKSQPLHIRLPQRAEQVEGEEPGPGQRAKNPSEPDPRTASQDPPSKPRSDEPA